MAERIPVLVTDLRSDAELVGDRKVTTGHRVRLLGTLKGDLVVNEGGKVELFGAVEGDIYAFGRVNIHDGATVSGRLVGDGIRDRREASYSTESFRARSLGSPWTL